MAIHIYGLYAVKEIMDNDNAFNSFIKKRILIIPELSEEIRKEINVIFF